VEGKIKKEEMKDETKGNENKSRKWNKRLINEKNGEGRV
jgi:hypothetical protein